MEEIYKNMGFIIGFLSLVLIVQNFFGEKGSENFVLLILISMIIINADKFGSWLNSFN